MCGSWLTRLRRLVGVPRQTVVLTAKIDTARDDLLRIIDALHHVAAAEDARAHQLRAVARQARSRRPEAHDPTMRLQTVRNLVVRHIDQAVVQSDTTAEMLDKVIDGLGRVAQELRDG